MEKVWVVKDLGFCHECQGHDYIIDIFQDQDAAKMAYKRLQKDNPGEIYDIEEFDVK
jgi:hypothetical protein